MIANFATVEDIKVISKLQNISKEVFRTVTSHLESDISEVDIAGQIRIEFKKRNVLKFWYTVPIIVLIGTERFINGANANYDTKKPDGHITLQDGSIIYIDLHPTDTKTELWGDWNSMIVYHPRDEKDSEQVSFLEEMRQIHREGISKITSSTTGKELVDFYTHSYELKGITPIWNNIRDIGHTIHSGPKESAKRRFITADDLSAFSNCVIAIEPSGFKKKKNSNEFVVARFEECVYVPESGKATLLGNNDIIPLIV